MAAVELFFFYLFGAAAPLSLAALNAGLVGLALFFLWRLFRGKYRPGPAEWLLIIFIAWNVVSAFSGPMPAKALHGVLNYWSWSALFIAAALPSAVRRHWRRFSAFLALSAALTLPISFCTFAIGTNFHRNRLFGHRPPGTVCSYGFFSHHLTYAGVMILVVSMTAALAVYGRRRKGWWSLAAFVSLLNLLLSQARGYYLAAIPTAFVLVWKKGKRWLLVIAVGGILASALVFTAGPASFRTRIENTWNMQNAGNAERVYLWVSGFQMVMDRPIAGWGPGIYKDTAGPYKAPYANRIHYPTHIGFQTVSHAHNLFLMAAIQSGIIGLLLFLAFIVAAFRGMLRQENRALRFGAMAALTAFLAGGLFEFNGGDAEVAMLVFFLVGLALGNVEVGRETDETASISASDNEKSGE